MGCRGWGGGAGYKQACQICGFQRFLKYLRYNYSSPVIIFVHIRGENISYVRKGGGVSENRIHKIEKGRV